MTTLSPTWASIFELDAEPSEGTPVENLYSLEGCKYDWELNPAATSLDHELGRDSYLSAKSGWHPSGSAATGISIGGLDVDVLVSLTPHVAGRPCQVYPRNPDFADISRALSNVRSTGKVLIKQLRSISPIADEERALLVELDDPPEAVRVFDQLKEWTGESTADIAAMAGFGRTTRYDWERSGRNPRASTVRRLYSIHSLCQSVMAAVEAGGFRAWFNAGSPSPRDAAISGDLDRLHALADAVLLRDVTPEAVPAYSEYVEEPEQPEIELRSAEPRRGRL